MRESLAAKRARATTLVRTLKNAYPEARIALDFTTPLELLVATILAAQCTDARVNLVTPALFRKYRSARDWAGASLATLEREIHSTGFFRAKARALTGMARALVERHGGQVPRTRAELVRLPGVGLKTASVVLGNAFGEPAIAVDTHVFRVSQRLGLARADDPEAMVVTILCDTGERYLSKLYDDTWMRENQMMEAERVTAGQLLERHPAEIPPLVSVGPSASLRQALNLLSTWSVSQIPVVDGDDCVGSVTEGHLPRVLADSRLLERPVSEVMGGPFPVVDADVPLDRLTVLLSKETPAALIRRGGRLVGILNRYDVLRQIAGIG